MPPFPPPPTQTAIVGTAAGGLAVSHAAPVPAIEDDMVLVRTAAVSINPVDTKMTGAYATAGAVAGCDFAGTVVAVGAAARSQWREGDRVCGAVMGMNPLQPAVGAFAQFVAARSARILRVPEHMAAAQAAALPTAFMTAGLALFQSLALPGDPLHPAARALPVLVSGGATATGTAAIQLLRAAGFAPVATSSPANFALVRSYGAAAVFDYTRADCAAAVRAHTAGGLRHALDCVATPESMRLAYAAIGRAGGRYCALDPFAPAVARTRAVVRPDWVLGPVLLGADIAWPAPHGRPADPAMALFGARWVRVVQQLLDAARLREHPLVVRAGDFDDVLAGVDALRKKKLSGQKLVYNIK